MKTALFKALLGSALLLLLMLACTLALRFYKTIVPEHVEHDTINYTAADLDQARGKWAGQGITRYSMRLFAPREEYLLEVDETAGTVNVLEHYVGNRREATGLYSIDEARNLTVQGLFDAASERLTYELGSAATPDEEGMTTYYDYWVVFDGRYGYPSEASDYERGTLTTREIVWRTTLNKVEIKDFKPID